MSDANGTDPGKHSMKPIYVGAIIVGAAWVTVLIATLVVFFGACDATAARWGQFGDAFGTVNALFSGLALLGVVYAILLQREDLELQRKELRASIKAQEDAALAQASQARIAAMTAALSAKQYISESLAEAAKHGSGVTKIKGRELGLADVVEHYKKQMLKIDSLLEAELAKAVPEYRAETPG
ncbi:MAG: hypothetical protein JNK53_01220 [Phycisphaerae bacterium]|nr:hypothetical protein [Phycisphaerae bacterium]